MPKSDLKEARFRFEDFVVDAKRGALLRKGEEIPLRPQCYQVLLLLVENAGQLVSREELLKSVWAGKVVTDASVTQCLVDIRAAIDDARHEKIRTLARRGYRFELPVVRVEPRLRWTDTIRNEFQGRQRSARIAAVAVVVALAGVLWVFSEGERTDVRGSDGNPGKPVLAALPLENLSPTRQRDEFVLGFHDVLLSELGRQNAMDVIGRWSLMDFGASGADRAEMNERLGADLVLSGGVARDESNIRFTFQLQDVATGVQLWAETYLETYSADQLLTLQRTVAERVAKEAAMQAAGAGQSPVRNQARIPRFPATDNLTAYERYLDGTYYLRLIETGRQELDLVARGRREFEAAIAADPDWSPPYAALARLLHFVASTHTVPDAWRESWRLIDKALQLDPDYGPAYASLGFLEYRWGGDFEAAENAYLRAQQLGESADWGLAILYTAQGRIDQSLRHYRKAVAADPLNPAIRGQYGRNLVCDEQWQRAVEVLSAVANFWSSPQFNVDLAYAQVRAGAVAEGRALWTHNREAFPDLDGLFYLALGEEGRARVELERRLEAEPLPTVETSLLAIELGETDRALGWLERRAEADPKSLRHMLCAAPIRALAGNARFDRILETTGLR
jgi:DNA-binding winged helix-turn-helix (wHTH) protein/TolB-like protein